MNVNKLLAWNECTQLPTALYLDTQLDQLQASVGQKNINNNYNHIHNFMTIHNAIVQIQFECLDNAGVPSYVEVPNDCSSV